MLQISIGWGFASLFNTEEYRGITFELFSIFLVLKTIFLSFYIVNKCGLENWLLVSIILKNIGQCAGEGGGVEWPFFVTHAFNDEFKNKLFEATTIWGLAF